MSDSFWQKQTKDSPLFPDLLWSRPENKNQAGKLLIIGGNLHGFAAIGEAYNEALKAGVGMVRVMLPDALHKTVIKIFPEAEFAPSTPSGSFARSSLAEALAEASWADAVLIAGDLGRNSETAIMLEQLTDKYKGQLTITQNALDYFTKSPIKLLDRQETVIVASLGQLQRLGTALKFKTVFTLDMDLIRLTEALHEFSRLHKSAIITKSHDNLLVGYDGKVSSSKLTEEIEAWRVRTAAHAAVWQLQNPNKVFEALTISLLAT